jgi:hypothetical protein
MICYLRLGEETPELITEAIGDINNNNNFKLSTNARTVKHFGIRQVVSILLMINISVTLDIIIFPIYEMSDNLLKIRRFQERNQTIRELFIYLFFFFFCYFIFYIFYTFYIFYIFYFKLINLNSILLNDFLYINMFRKKAIDINGVEKNVYPVKQKSAKYDKENEILYENFLIGKEFELTPNNVNNDIYNPSPKLLKSLYKPPSINSSPYDINCNQSKNIVDEDTYCINYDSSPENGLVINFKLSNNKFVYKGETKKQLYKSSSSFHDDKDDGFSDIRDVTEKKKFNSSFSIFMNSTKYWVISTTSRLLILIIISIPSLTPLKKYLLLFILK